MSGIEDPNIDIAFDRWFGYLSAQGDPALRIDLVTEAFVAGWNASRDHLKLQIGAIAVVEVLKTLTRSGGTDEGEDS